MMVRSPMITKLAWSKGKAPASVLARCARFVRLSTAVETTIKAEEVEELLARVTAAAQGQDFIFTPEMGACFAAVLEGMAMQLASKNVLKEITG